MSILVYHDLQQLPEPCAVTDCAVSGGTLEDYLNRAVRECGQKLCVRIYPVYMDFPLPCPGGIGQFLTQEAFTRRRNTLQPHFSPALGTEYCTLRRADGPHVLLGDTRETLRWKLRLCQRLGVAYAITPVWLEAE